LPEAIINMAIKGVHWGLKKGSLRGEQIILDFEWFVKSYQR